MIDIKIEHNKCKLGAVTPIGIMFEINAPEMAPAAIAAKLAARKPQTLVFVVDRSGSMGGGRLEMVKQTLLQTLPRLYPGDFFGVVSFDNHAKVEVPITPVGQGNLQFVMDQVSRLQPGGNTNMESGLRLGMDIASKASLGTDRTLILLSDGHANSGATSSVVLGGMAKQALELHRVNTSTIGIGLGYHEGILEAIATQGNGNHLAALEQAEVSQALQAEIDTVLQKTMSNISFKISPNPELAGGRTVTSAARRMKTFDRTHRGGAVATYRDLAAGEQVNVVFQLDLDARVLPAGMISGFKARIEYFDEVEQRTIRFEQRIDLELVEPGRWVAPQRDAAIRAELQELRLQAIRDQAMALYEEGREAEADRLLDEAAKEFELFLEDIKFDLSDRNFGRFSDTRDEFMAFSTMGDINIKRKMMAESRNRAARDRRNYRNPGQN